MMVRIAGEHQYLRRSLWRAVDDEGEVLDVVLQRRRGKQAARKLLRNLLRKQGFADDGGRILGRRVQLDRPEGRELFYHPPGPVPLDGRAARRPCRFCPPQDQRGGDATRPPTSSRW